MIKVKHKGDFSKTVKYLKRVSKASQVADLERYGKEGVEALAAATPVETGKTANSWYYVIERTKSSVTLKFLNSNIQNGIPIAVIIQYGHGTRNGGWVEGRDYINPAIQPIFDKIRDDVWREVTKS
jgi:hypothetical protein